LHIRLAYGKSGLTVDFPDEWDVTLIEPRYLPALPDQAEALRRALGAPIGAPPLRRLARPDQKVGIIFSDITRHTPHRLILPAVLNELRHVPQQNITLFNALGTHRRNTELELRGMLGNELVDGYRIVQNDAFDPATQVHLGCTSFGHEIWLNAELAACDVKILTGFIEPHFFAGFSGGCKAIMPGMGGLRTILGNHDARNIGHPKATWGVTWGNPIWEEVRDVACRVRGTFLVNVSLNRDGQITAVFAGDLDGAHARGCEYVRNTAMVAAGHPFDIVVTTNSGYPLDLNLYQSVKGMRAAEQIVRPGGVILIAAECWDGIPEHGLYGRLLREVHSPRELLERIQSPDFLEQDQWQAQIQAMIQLKAEVYVYSDHLSDAQIRAALLEPCRDIPATIAELRRRFGEGAKIAVLPEGPQTIAYLDPEVA
jgi:nickel-dependent lactate racemase